MQRLKWPCDNRQRGKSFFGIVLSLCGLIFKVSQRKRSKEDITATGCCAFAASYSGYSISYFYPIRLIRLSFVNGAMHTSVCHRASALVVYNALDPVSCGTTIARTTVLMPADHNPYLLTYILSSSSSRYMPNLTEITALASW